MLRARLPDLRPEDRDRVLAALRETASESRLRAELGEQLSVGDDEKVRQLARWQLLKWFHELGSARPDSILAEYEELRAELGEPSGSIGRPRIGPNSPQDARALAALDDEQLVGYLREWVPPSPDPFEPSREGLGRELKKCVDSDGVRFARLARELRGTSSAYVANLFWSIHEQASRWREAATASGVSGEIDWDSLLDLLEWTIAQPAANDVGWNWARRMAVGVAEDILTVSASADHVRTSRSWSAVRALMRDQDPTPARDAARDGDLDSFAINTVRGEALSAAVRIGATLRQTGATALPGLLAEVVDEIIARADNGVEPSLGIRCVLAFGFNDIYRISATAAAEVAAQLLPRNGDASPDRRVGWQCFLRWNQAFGGTYALLREAYAIAVDEVGAAEPDDANRLGDHLAWLAANGVLDFSRDDSQLRAYIEHAPPDACHHALEGIGRAIYQTEEHLPEDVLERLRAFWGWWSTLVIGRDDPAELRAFGWWFASRHFDPVWSLSNLHRALTATGGRIDWQHEVLEKLVTMASSASHEVAGCLELIVDTRDDWNLIGGRGRIRSLLEALVPTSAVDAAHTIAARLVARGRLDFRDLT
jgi:hypothetical protein